MSKLKHIALSFSLMTSAGLMAAPVPNAPVRIEMKSISFGPKAIDIVEGQSIQWENTSLTDHSATSDDEGNTFDTGMIDPKRASKPVEFAKAGVYHYHCMMHGRTMSGLINVKPKS
ncbi:MAG: cupredoxin domain-containing protein [Chitinophagaceae bacterium]|nr:cupredoxin domain-containing protein [Oligoflexus sp.]